ncbi:hypothetical protein [Shinella granuli]|uniref:hypothetical protein n=1 Tax=Shinella granuli TaxID=323621 RepID=UPI00105579BE|nr:hypothetical protein [Shinella granuli]
MQIAPSFSGIAAVFAGNRTPDGSFFANIAARFDLARLMLPVGYWAAGRPNARRSRKTSVM